MILRIEQLRLGKLFAESGMNTPMFLEPQALFSQQSFRHIKHSVVSSTRRPLRVAIFKQSFRRSDGSVSFIDESLGGFFHQASGLCRQGFLTNIGEKRGVSAKPVCFGHENYGYANTVL